MIIPMVARLVRDPFDHGGWGFRAVAEIDLARTVKLYSRKLNDFTKRFQPIADALAELKRSAIVVGEIGTD